jgi:hypothetical protein
MISHSHLSVSQSYPCRVSQPRVLGGKRVALLDTTRYVGVYPDEAGGIVVRRINVKVK